MDAPILARGVEIAHFLMREPNPLTMVGAAAVAGNAWQENLCRPVTIGQKDHGSDGMMQWRLGRLVRLKQLPHWDTLEVQCQFFKDECRKQYPHVWHTLIDPRWTLDAAVGAVCWRFERPAIQYAALAARLMYAHRVYDAVREMAAQQGTS